MKVCIVANCASRGGAERVAVLLANYLCDKGYDVIYAAILLDEIKYDIDSRVKYIFCGVEGGNKFTRSIKRYSNLLELVKRNNVDTVVSFMTLENLFLPLKKDLYKIYSMRSDPERTFNTGIKKILRDYIYSSSDIMVFQTQGTKKYFSKRIQEKSVVLGNPIIGDLPYWNENCSKVILAAGRLTDAKDFPMLINAFSMFAKKKPDYRLLIYGEGELRGQLQSLIDSNGLTESVILAGNVNDIHKRMAEAEIYVSSSKYEGISNSMIEALAIGVPTICTDVASGGAREYIRNGENGYLVKVGDATELYTQMMILAENIELRRKFSVSSRKIRQELSADKIFGEWEKLICNGNKE